MAINAWHEETAIFLSIILHKVRCNCRSQCGLQINRMINHRWPAIATWMSWAGSDHLLRAGSELEDLWTAFSLLRGIRSGCLLPPERDPIVCSASGSQPGTNERISPRQLPTAAFSLLRGIRSGCLLPPERDPIVCSASGRQPGRSAAEPNHCTTRRGSSMGPRWCGFSKSSMSAKECDRSVNQVRPLRR